MVRTFGILLVTTFVALAASADEPGQGVLNDALLDELEGEWRMEGTLLGESVEYSLNARWVLGHQFLLLEMQAVGDPTDYEADIYIGFDPSRDRYVVHWLDRFGGKASSTLGFGQRDDETMRLFFDYPSGKFRDEFTFDRDAGRWHFAIDARNDSGEWTEFARYVVIRQGAEE